MKNKIFDSVDTLLASYPSVGRGSVVTKGVYDLFHVGHLRSLNFAKKQGSKLIIALKSDRVVRDQKGQKRPIIDFLERAEILSAIDLVDFIIPMNSPDVDVLLSGLEASCFVASSFDSNTRKLAKNSKFGLKLVAFPKTSNVSTSGIIDIIKSTK